MKRNKLYINTDTDINSKEFKAASKYLIKLNEQYHKHLYLHSFKDLKKERMKQRDILNSM